MNSRDKVAYVQLQLINELAINTSNKLCLCQCCESFTTSNMVFAFKSQKCNFNIIKIIN